MCQDFILKVLLIFQRMVRFSEINLLNKGYTYKCNIYEVQKDNNCNECVKIQLEMKK